MTNTNPQTGLRYSVIAFNSLQPWCSEDLFYGPKARDLSYEAAIEELKARARADYDNCLEQAHIAAAEADHGMGEEDHCRFLQKWFDEQDIEYDEEDFVSDFVERNAEHLQIDEPIIEGVYDGVSYRISWLGGAPLLWVFDGPRGYGNRLCSPCVPGAVDGGGGYVLESELAEGEKCVGYTCHCPPRDWLADPQ